jgi:hypothetical protein
VAPTLRSTASTIEPVPLAVQVAPLEAMHVHDALSSEAGSASVTVAPTTADGPPLRTTIVYATVAPGVAVVVPSVFVTLRSAIGVTESLSVALSFVGVGSDTPTGAVTLAVLDTMPVAVGDRLATTA